MVWVPVGMPSDRMEPQPPSNASNVPAVLFLEQPGPISFSLPGPFDPYYHWDAYIAPPLRSLCCSSESGHLSIMMLYVCQDMHS